MPTLLDAYLNSTNNIDRADITNKTSIDSTKVDYSYNRSDDMPELRTFGNYWGNSKKIGISTLLDRTLADTKRISKFMLSNKGLMFTLEQQGLHLMQPKGENIGINQRRIFNPLKFVSNVVGSPNGYHIEKHGLPGLDGDYEKVIKFKNSNTTHLTDNRLVRVYNELGKRDESNAYTNVLQQTNNQFLNKIISNKFVGVVADRFLPFNGQIIQTLSGVAGPKSVFGVGSTNIKTYSFGSPIKFSYIDENNKENFYTKYNNENTYDKNINETQILSDEHIPETTTKYNADYTYDKNINETHTLIPTYQNTPMYEYSEKMKDYSNFNTYDGDINVFVNETTFEDSYPTRIKTKDKKIYSEDDVYYQNWNFYKRLDMPDLSGNENLKKDAVDKINMGHDDVNDFVKLKIGGVQFRCTIEGFSDSFSPSWGSTRYIGRPDDVRTYEGNSRSISFSFIVVAKSEKEMKGIYYKLNRLAQIASPDINGVGIMVGQVIDLKLGMWFAYSANKGLPVIMTSLSYNIDSSYVWDIIKELPMVIKVDVGFDVIGNAIPSNKTIFFGKASSNSKLYQTKVVANDDNSGQGKGVANKNNNLSQGKSN